MKKAFKENTIIVITQYVDGDDFGPTYFTKISTVNKFINKLALAGYNEDEMDTNENQTWTKVKFDGTEVKFEIIQDAANFVSGLDY